MVHSVRYFGSIALMAIASVIFTGCFPLAPLHEETFEFRPTRVASIFGDKQVQRFGLCSGLDRRGTRLFLWDEFVRQHDTLVGAPRPIALAGYEVGVTRGDSCHIRVLDTFQAAVAFDLSSLPTSAVSHAELRIRQRLSLLDPPRPVGNQEQCEVLRVYQATQDWRSGLFAPDTDFGPLPFISHSATRATSDHLRAGILSRSSVDVTQAVSMWARGSRPNFGFTLTPDLEDVTAMFERTDSEPGWVCDFGIIDVELVVTVAVPDN